MLIPDVRRHARLEASRFLRARAGTAPCGRSISAWDRAGFTEADLKEPQRVFPGIEEVIRESLRTNQVLQESLVFVQFAGYYRRMYLAAEPRTTLEVLILVLLKQGLSTTYDLQTQAGLSLGATVPALKRLAAAKLVTKKASGRKYEFSLTHDGEKTISSWSPTGRPPSELDDLLRTAYLIWLIRRDKAGAVAVLRQGAKARGRWAEERHDEAAGFDVPKIAAPTAEAYRWMRTVSEAARFSAESEALESLALTLEPQRRRK